jgi:DNA (cytosine-5)-methyltransferase 1
VADRQLPLFRAYDDLVVDLFAGGGGASVGVEAALGRPVDIAINHSPLALKVHCDNHPHTLHLTANLRRVKPREVVQGRRVSFLWASPDCRDHSNAKGGKPRRQKLRSLPWIVVRWARDVRPEFTGWGPLDENGKRIKQRKGEFFRRWVKQLRRYGYTVEWRSQVACDFGSPTRRRRFVLLARRDGQPIVWPSPTHGPGRARPYHTAAECIQWNKYECRSIFGRKRPLAEKTMWRIAQGLRRFVFENPRPFIVKVNHGKWEPRHENIDEPLSTVTATQRGHALVLPVLQQSGYGERDGQRARALDLEAPLGTVVAAGQKHALVAAFLARYFGDPLRTDGGGGVVSGADLANPLPTITRRDHHALATVNLVKFRGTHENQPASAAVDEPMPTISSGGGRGGVHVAEVRAFLTAYYGNDRSGGQELTEPMRTITTKARLGLVTVAGADYQITDICFRMIEPDELLAAQFGKYAASYDLSSATTKADKISLIGNSAPPEMIEAHVAANNPRDRARAA